LTQAHDDPRRQADALLDHLIELRNA